MFDDLSQIKLFCKHLEPAGGLQMVKLTLSPCQNPDIFILASFSPRPIHTCKQKNFIFPCLDLHLSMRVKGDCPKVRRPMNLTLRFNEKKNNPCFKAICWEIFSDYVALILPTYNFLPCQNCIVSRLCLWRKKFCVSHDCFILFRIFCRHWIPKGFNFFKQTNKQCQTRIFSRVLCYRK